MRIAILGNGKMGKYISALALEKGHTIEVSSNSKNPVKNLDLSTSDVAFDFSSPKSAFENIVHAINQNVPVISGTTGWTDKIKEVHRLCKKKNGAFLYSPNFT